MYSLPVLMGTTIILATTIAAQESLSKSYVYDATLADLTTSTPFDLYILALSWQPEFCRSKGNHLPGCREPAPYWRNHFTLHGLWPELAHGAHPEFCGGPPFDPKEIIRQVGIDAMVQYWPDVKYNISDPSYSDFWAHEWTRHGSCSKLDQVTYFSSAVNILRNDTQGTLTPQLIQDNLGSSISLKDLRASFAPSENGLPPVVLKCDRGGVLAQVFMCWDKDEKNRPTHRTKCPDHILKEDTCRGVKVYIQAFPQM